MAPAAVAAARTCAASHLSVAARAAPRSSDEPVWYVAYGSNLSSGRLFCYLSGAAPGADAYRHHWLR